MLTGNAAVLNQGQTTVLYICVYLLMKQYNLTPEIGPSLDRMQQCCIYTLNQKTSKTVFSHAKLAWF